MDAQPRSRLIDLLSDDETGDAVTLANQPKFITHYPKPKISKPVHTGNGGSFKNINALKM